MLGNLGVRKLHEVRQQDDAAQLRGEQEQGLGNALVKDMDNISVHVEGYGLHGIGVPGGRLGQYGGNGAERCFPETCLAAVQVAGEVAQDLLAVRIENAFLAAFKKTLLA